MGVCGAPPGASPCRALTPTSPAAPSPPNPPQPSPTLPNPHQPPCPQTYQFKYPAPGDPALAQRVLGLLGSAGIAAGADASRGYDHGTFVPLMLAYPEARVPVVQMSVLRSMDPG